MKTTVNYNDYDETTKPVRAMNDIMKYIGDKERFDKIHDELKKAIKDGLNLRGMEFQCGMFLGIEGYPVQAWFDTIKNELRAEGTVLRVTE